VSNDELLGQLTYDEGVYEEVVGNELENDNEHNKDNEKDLTQITEKEYEEESDYDDENVDDAHEFYYNSNLFYFIVDEIPYFSHLNIGEQEGILKSKVQTY